jgi:hypothetical protein
MAKKDDTKPDTGDNADEPDTGDATAADVEKWKGLARKHEARAKAAQAEIDKAKAEAATANKSDMDKLSSTVEQLRADLAEERRKSMVAEIAADKGLSPAQARRLTGSTREELEADADDIVEAFGIKPDKGDDDDKGDKSDKAGTNGKGDQGDKPGIGRPKEKLRPGAAGDDTEGEIDRKKADELAKDIESGGFM